MFRNLIVYPTKILSFIFYPLIWVYRLVRGWLHSNIIAFSFFLMLMILSGLVLWQRIVVTVPAGSLAVLYRPLLGGIDLDRVLGEGVHFLFPLNKITVYDGRIQKSLITMEVLTKDQLKSEVVVSFQYKISSNTLPLLDRYVGLKYLDTIIIPAVTGKTRVMFAEMSSQDAFTQQISKVVDEIAISSDQVILEKLGPPGISYVRLLSISSVQLESINFQEDIQSAIRAKITEEQKAEAYVHKLKIAKFEAQRKELEAEGIKKFQEIVNVGLTEGYLKFQGIEATIKLAESNNAKIVVFGSSPSGLPLLFGGETSSGVPATASQTTTTQGGQIPKVINNNVVDVKTTPMPERK